MTCLLYTSQPRKKGMGYLCEMTVDTSNGIITGVDCFGANRRESDIILKHLQKQQETLELDINHLTLDSGYDVGAVHRGLELLDIIGYCSPIKFHNNALKKGFEYDSACLLYTSLHHKSPLPVLPLSQSQNGSSKTESADRRR